MNVLERAFARMGARVEFAQVNRRSRFSVRIASEDLALDVRRDQHGEYFQVSRAPASTTELVVLDVQPIDRHLLLLSRSGAEKHRFLLGHDERHWFVAGIPETAPVSRVKMLSKLSSPISSKAASANFGRSIATGAATHRAFDKGSGFLYQRRMPKWRSFSFCATNR